MNRYQLLHNYLFFLLTNLFFCSLLFFSSLDAAINSDGDIEYWQYFSYEHRFSKKHGMQIQTELRFADDVSKAYFTYIQGQYIFKPTLCFSFAPGYRQQYSRSELRDWRHFYSPMADINFMGDFKQFKWIDRSRIQYVVGPDRNRALYRNRLRFTLPGKTISYTLDDEIFFTQGAGFSQNRLSFGPIINIGPYFSTRLFYMLRHIKISDWRVNHVFGCYLFYNF